MKIAMHYDDDAYVEISERADASRQGRKGVWGRHVAGKEFLDAYLTHGSWNELVALVRNRPSRQSIVRFCEDHPSSRAVPRRLQVFDERNFHDSFLPRPPATLLYTPQPPDERYAWARQHADPHSFAICGVTHTLCSARAVRWLVSLITAPFEEYDALICTSRAVVQMVRALVGSYTDFLHDRYGGDPRLKVRLETIPLGVNTETFRPATPAERAKQRAVLQIEEDEIVFLFVGRFAAHAKAHPFPIYYGLQEATRRTGKKVHLVLSGWAKNDKILKAFVDGAQAFAPDVRLTVVDGTQPDLRFGVWRAADVFVSLSDNIQETFGLVIVEAMACGLPVVAADWNGYRDLVTDKQTGFLVPTTMIPGATWDSTARLLMGQVRYDRFLGDCNQTVVVDNQATTDAFTRLIEDAALRRHMGAAGRRRALDCFAWPHIVKAYEKLWESQDQERRLHLAKSPRDDTSRRGPAIYPPPEISFAGYPTQWLRDDQQLAIVPGAEGRLDRLLSQPLTNYAANRRTDDPKLLRALLAAAETRCTPSELKAALVAAGLRPDAVSATVAWSMKYGLLQLAGDSAVLPPSDP